MESSLDKTMADFVGVTAKSTVVAIVPLYGFWSDIPDNPVNGTVLRLALSRLYSNVHHLYVIFVANEQSLPHDLQDPDSVANVLLGWSKRGNCQFIPVGREATYSEYLKEGMNVALKETKAQYVMVLNPWVMIKEGGVDVLIDRANRSDQAKIISGYDLRSVIEPENFEDYKINIPIEEYDLVFDFLAMPRWMAETVKLDAEFRTHSFLARDTWQQATQKSYDVVASQKIPIFSFDFPWSDYESREDFDADQQRFASKWRFNPGIKYEDTRGAGRRDKTGAR